MKLISGRTAALNQTPLDWDGNERRILQAITEARGRQRQYSLPAGACLTGYGCEDAFHAHGTREAALLMLERLLPETRGMVVSFDFHSSSRMPSSIRSASWLTGVSSVFCAKQFLAGDGIHYEPRCSRHGQDKSGRC